MATDYTHAVVGLAMARLAAPRPMHWTYWALAALLPVAADLDVFFGSGCRWARWSAW